MLVLMGDCVSADYRAWPVSDHPELSLLLLFQEGIPFDETQHKLQYDRAIQVVFGECKPHRLARGLQAFLCWIKCSKTYDFKPNRDKNHLYLVAVRITECIELQSATKAVLKEESLQDQMVWNRDVACSRPCLQFTSSSGEHVEYYRNKAGERAQYVLNFYARNKTIDALLSVKLKVRVLVTVHKWQWNVSYKFLWCTAQNCLSIWLFQSHFNLNITALLHTDSNCKQAGTTVLILHCILSLLTSFDMQCRLLYTGRRVPEIPKEQVTIRKKQAWGGTSGHLCR